MNKGTIQQTLPATRLWLALVDHQIVPGTRPVLFAQPTEPLDPDIFSRLGTDASADELQVSGLFDLSHVLGVDPESRQALEQFVRSTPSAREIPSTVKDRVRFTLNGLREQEAALQGVQRARGNGHFLALELQDRVAKIRHGLDRLSEFRALAAKNGADADAFIQECGGVPDFACFGYVHPNPAVMSEVTSDGMSDAEVVQGAERMARVLLKAWGFGFTGESVRNSKNPRAISAWSVVTSMLEEYNGTDLSSAVDSSETEGVDVHEAVEAGPRPDPAGATQFFKELLDSMETLGNVAYKYGPRTLADLMYLQNAVAKGTFIEHYPEESSVMVVVKGLPSADRWAAYVQQCDNVV
ncbi:hypothetical protein [Cupriavidus sp. AcVe19-6a]|uniref:hypothetical protein n=1 Tax=Cupriavidus sp. AcVe19-6a TaxID=2821358 RepID=UPI001FD836F9|nr:hypothetical protein [Cupriavidus sp. AcVe19-6a]